MCNVTWVYLVLLIFNKFIHSNAFFLSLRDKPIKPISNYYSLVAAYMLEVLYFSKIMMVALLL